MCLVIVIIMSPDCQVSIILAITIRFSDEKHTRSPLYSLWFTVASLFGQGVEDLPS